MVNIANCLEDKLNKICKMFAEYLIFNSDLDKRIVEECDDWPSSCCSMR